jgi:glycosyltransferase involved in cell wall biosynthesis
MENLYGAYLADHTCGVYYSPFYGSMHTKIPQVFSAYDMIYEKYPQYFPSFEYGIRRHIREKKACFERASLIVCISIHTANDILEIYPHIPKERLKVVHLGVEELFFRDGEAVKQTRPYFLYVGHRERYKNFLRFLDAFGRTGLKKDYDLCIVSPIAVAFTVQEKETIARYGLAGTIRINVSISDEVLKEQYAGARAFVYPTEYEGFGLPVAEALACGTLVLTSQAPCLKEIGGTAPLYFDPTSTDAIADALQAADQMNDSERQRRILTGKKWSSQFSWDNSRRGFVQAMKELIDENSSS